MISCSGKPDDGHSDLPTNPDEVDSATTRLSVCAILESVTRTNERRCPHPPAGGKECAVGNMSGNRDGEGRMTVRVGGDDWKVGKRGGGPCAGVETFNVSVTRSPVGGALGRGRICHTRNLKKIKLG